MIFASTPSSCASTSIVALSVSISTSTSPAANVSPSLSFQLAMPPSVIVGDIAGIWNLERAGEGGEVRKAAAVRGRRPYVEDDDEYKGIRRWMVKEGERHDFSNCVEG